MSKVIRIWSEGTHSDDFYIIDYDYLSISFQTHIVEALARTIADGHLDCQYVRVESKFSAAGSCSYTASSSQGLLLMVEILYASAGMRVPFVITGVNRATLAPITIQVPQETISLRDTGLIHLYAESSQETYDTHIAAFKIAEDPCIILHVLVCMEGWILIHQQKNRDTYLHIKERLDDGIIVSGMKAHITGAINSHEILTMPRTMGEEDKDFAVSFAISSDTKGVIFAFCL